MLHLVLSFNFMFHTYAAFLNIVNLYGPLRYFIVRKSAAPRHKVYLK